MIRPHSPSVISAVTWPLFCASVVEGVVHAPEPVDRRGERGLRVLAASHVADDGESLTREALDHPDCRRSVAIGSGRTQRFQEVVDPAFALGNRGRTPA